MVNPEIKVLPSGYLHIRWHTMCWAQIPPGFSGDTIPDEHIFDPEWNAKDVNEWWRRGGRAFSAIDHQTRSPVCTAPLRDLPKAAQ